MNTRVGHITINMFLSAMSSLPQIFAVVSVHPAYITHGPKPGGSFVGRDDTSRVVGECSELCDDVLEVDGLER